MDKGGQQVGPSVGTFARLKRENMDLRQENKDLMEQLINYQELRVAAEAIEGPAAWFDKDVRRAVTRLHKAIRKVRGMRGS